MNAPLRLCAAGVACALAMSAQLAYAVAPAPTTEGHLVTRRGAEVVDVPLAHTEVHLRVSGMLVDATVTQHFRNPYADKIEAVYLFPLPTGAAVDDLVIKSGDRTIHGQIAERTAAKRTYLAAKARGQVAALLTEERPNLFTQTIANLEPGATIDVTLHYVERLAPTEDGYELVFPMVAPPRYVPAGAAAAQDPTAVSPTVLPPGQRSSHDISLDVDLDAAVALTTVDSPSHHVAMDRPSSRRARLHLAPDDTIPNKDFVLRYRVAGAAPALGALAFRDGAGDGTFLFIAQPPVATAPVAIAPRELVVILDTSSSMRGKPLAKAKDLVRRLLADLRPDDTFQLVRFDDTAAALAPAPIANKPHNVAVALQWLGALDAGGATEVTAGLDTAFAQPHDPNRLRVAVFVGDGFVGDEDAILARATAELGTGRLFCFGVGSAVNRYLLEELARVGRGALQVIRPDEDATAAIATFARRIDAPILTDVTIDWGGLAVRDVSPAALPDLFLGQPLLVSGHYARPGRGVVTVHGTQAGRRVSLALAVELPAQDPDRPALAALWARDRIAELSRQLVRKADPAVEQQILALSLASHVLTRFTAFVAVDDSRTTAGGAARTVAVPVEVPDAVRGVVPGSAGMIYGGVFGGEVGEMSGGFGYGTIGISVGGGGSYGVGEGFANVVGHGAGYGTGGGGVGKAAFVPDITIGTAEVAGELDAAIVRRYVKRQHARLQYCYEKQLLVSPGLHGELVLEFTIDEDGKVTTSTASGVDPAIASCAAEVIHAVEFPRTVGGGASVIHYAIQLVLAGGH